ncbi:putative zinc finger protein [Pseudonocardia sediminis]|uniref:Putative zinc finger protein n=1 Tax=Pseudonocardia sediminis TaxID=1397368 RepID=A0A4Q7UUA3_PSEST|nr:zf-HC2 domain-containing protein [Pseudonocardia sediminis]RZT85316.1 putative zinc finger protein [Pseudonocardia sediminis]
MNTPIPDELHRELRERLGAYVLDALDADERAEVDAHLAVCPECRTEVDDLLPLVGPLSAVDADAVGPDSAEAESSPAATGGFAAILDRIRAEEAGGDRRNGTGPTVGDAGTGDAPPPDNVRPLRRTRSSSVRLAAAAAVIALAGIGIGTVLAPGESDGPLESVGVQALRPGIDAEAGVVPHTWGVEVKLTASGFDAGRTYRAAVLDSTGRPVGAGEFVGTGGDEMVCNLNSSVLRDRATGFVVTDAAGNPVLVSDFST